MNIYGLIAKNIQRGGARMEIKRDKYLNDLINRMHNGLIKVVTGIRRSGKSYLVFNIFMNYLLESKRKVLGCCGRKIREISRIFTQLY